MSDLNIQSVWPEWEIINPLREIDFGTVYLAREAETGAESAITVIKMPKEREMLRDAVSRGIGKRQLVMYFDKIAEDIQWETTMAKSISSPYFKSLLKFN